MTDEIVNESISMNVLVKSVSIFTIRPKNITFGTIVLVKVILVDVNVIVVLVKEIVEVVVEELVSCRRQRCHHHENEPHKAQASFSRHQPRASSPLPRLLSLL